MSNFISSIRYYVWSSYRRKNIDVLQEKHRDKYSGFVLDIGGRDRGKFKSPEEQVDKWIRTDINKDTNPDIVLDVANMTLIDDNSVNIINAIELFEHVKNIENGLQECFRVLKQNGYFIITVPFMYPVHADPNDYQRWTKEKWKIELLKVGFEIETIEVMGGVFTIFADLLKNITKVVPGKIRYIFLPFYVLLSSMVFLDNVSFIKNKKSLSGYVSGYFILCRKK